MANEGDIFSLDGNTGEIFVGPLEMIEEKPEHACRSRALESADLCRR